MRDSFPIFVAVFAVVIIAVSIWTARVARKRGRPMEFVDFAGQLGALMLLVSIAVKARAGSIAIAIAGTGLLLYSAWGHHRRARRLASEERRGAGLPDGPRAD